MNCLDNHVEVIIIQNTENLFCYYKASEQRRKTAKKGYTVICEIANWKTKASFVIYNHRDGVCFTKSVFCLKV